MHLTVPVELEDLVQKHLDAGSYPNLDAKIDRALDQVDRHQICTPEQARAKLDALKLSHLRDLG